MCTALATINQDVTNVGTASGDPAELDRQPVSEHA